MILLFRIKTEAFFNYYTMDIIRHSYLDNLSDYLLHDMWLWEDNGVSLNKHSISIRNYMSPNSIFLSLFFPFELNSIFLSYGHIS